MKYSAFKLLLINILLAISFEIDGQESAFLNDHYAQYDVHHYNINLDITNRSTQINGTTQISFSTDTPLDSISLELSELLTVNQVSLNENPVNHAHNGNILTTYADFDMNQLHKLQIDYQGTGGNEFFSGVFNRTAPYNKQVTYTLSEPYGSKFWFPCKQDLTDKADSVQLNLSCPDSVKAVSIGILDTVITLPGNKHQFIWKSNYPISYYLPAFTVGDFTNYSQTINVQGKEMLFENYIYNNSTYFSEQQANIDTTVFLLEVFSGMFGEYPFIEEKYGHVTAPLGGGMEHQTMSTMVDFGFYLVAHELAHQWFGDQITCGKWNDIWLNEGFASYSEYLALEKLPNNEGLIKNWLDREFSRASRDFRLSTHVPDIELDNPYRIFNGSTTYAKGATILHMMRNILNDDGQFFQILQQYVQQFAYGTAELEDFKQVVEDVSENNWDTFFDQWYYGNGYPVYNIFYGQENDSLKVTSIQLQNDTAHFFETPLVIEVEEQDTSYFRTIYHTSLREESSFLLNGELAAIRVDPQKKYLQSVNMLKKVSGPNSGLIFNIYPNPVENLMNIVFFKSMNKPFSIEIVTHAGRKVYEKRNITPNPEHQINLQNLPQGFYYVRLIADGQFYTYPIVKF